MITILICSAVAFFGMLLIFFSLLDSEREGMRFAGVLIIVATGVLGFGAVCGIVPYSSREIKVEKFTYSKTESTVTIECTGYFHTFTDAQTYNATNDSAQVFLIVAYNAYGYQVDRHIIVKK